MWLKMVNTSFCLTSEAVMQRCSVKKVFLEIQQNSKENTCARVSFFVNLHVSTLQLYFIKKETPTQVIPVNFAKFLRTPLVAASVTYRNILINFIVTLFIRCKFKWAISVKYQLHLYLPRFQNFDFQDFLGTPYINWFLTKQHFWQKLIIKN